MPFADPEKRAEYQRAYQKAWRARNPEKSRTYSRKWKSSDPDRAREMERARYAANCEIIRRRKRESYMSDPAKSRTQDVAKSRRNWAQRLLHNAGVNAANRGRGFGAPTITKAWILEQPLVCPHLGIPLIPPSSDPNAGRHSPNAPSLDRIDNSKGYEPGNVRLTSWLWNRFRGNLDEGAALDLLRSVAVHIVGNQAA